MSKEPLLPIAAGHCVDSPQSAHRRSLSFSEPFALAARDELSIPFAAYDLKDQHIFGSSHSPSDTITSRPSSGRRSLSVSELLSPLSPLPEHDELSLPIIPSYLKDRIIFGTSPSTSQNLTITSVSDPCSSSPDSNPKVFFRAARSHLHRCRTAPARPIDVCTADRRHRIRPTSRIVWQAFFLLAAYLLFGVLVYSWKRSDFEAFETHPFVDAIYFCIVTMCTIGYGDITPASPLAKLFSIAFVLLGFGFIDILLSGMVNYVLDLQEQHLLEAAERSNAKKGEPSSYIVDLKKGRMRIRLKVAIALGVVVLCVVAGAGFLWWFEKLGWLDAFYLSVMSVTTVGYGDSAFRTMGGRLFASVWLLVSTLAVARAFLYLTEARMHKRQRELAKWALARDLTVSEFHEADIDNNGFVSKSEFVVYKLKEMGMISEKDVERICGQFDRLDTGNCGKITLFDLIDNSNNSPYISSKRFRFWCGFKKGTERRGPPCTIHQSGQGEKAEEPYCHHR
ncbi:hypothetical protein HPP92_021185 [Vanilla planifolia]|uniref:Potassium channel domain-containing protein n=1 Tax=Vanilla planifolia TaxID=51239 RepID=A0A835PZD7_VANPL|nr:hypothetical protein HPP92_021185 [Vanilla planifolia]